MNQIILKGKKIFFSEQTSILSAATVIMVMTVASLILGLLRQRVILNFFNPDEAALFFAAFRLPDLVFEVLIYGMFSSAFIPIFTKLLRKGEHDAWDTAARTVNICLIIFGVAAVLIASFADRLYGLIAPGYSGEQIGEIASLARVMFFAQGIFVVSYVLTSVLEASRRFLIPALAPLFYNLGLIGGTLLLHSDFGLMAPVIGVVVGALIHFLIQLPLAMKLGFRFTRKVKPNEEIKHIAKLAAPRLIDLSVQQIADTTVLYFASLISTAAYTYFTLANSLQAAPVRLFGTSLAKAALPTLTRENENYTNFRNILFKTIYQMFFLVMPVVILFVVLRVPLVRLLFGTSIFDWKSTVETGMVLTGFAVGIAFQTFVPMLARAFYALHDTRTPVIISVIGDTFIVVSDLVLVKGYGFSSWALAFSYSLGAIIETLVLLFLLRGKLKNFAIGKVVLPMWKTLVAALMSGGVMYYLLKFFDKWVPVKIPRPLAFENFVLDTRYTGNLFILVILVSLAGGLIYIGVSLILKSDEVLEIGRLLWRRKGFVVPHREVEPIADLDKD